MPQPQENARVFLLIILVLWLVSFPDSGPGFISVPSITSARLVRQRQAQRVLNNTKWGDFSPSGAADSPDATPRYLNLTGFREGDGFVWEDLGRFRDRCVEWGRNANPSGDAGPLWDLGLAEPTWQNVTGSVHGEWVRREGSAARHSTSYNLSAISGGMSWTGAHGDWGRNMTGGHGKVIMRFEDRNRSLAYEDPQADDELVSGGLVNDISAVVTIQDDADRGSAWDMHLHGVHWPKQGAMLLTSTSEKFAGIFGLPHLSLGPNYFSSSKRLLNEMVDEILAGRERTVFSDPSNPWASTLEGQGESLNLAPFCEYVVYAQVHPLNPDKFRSKPHGDGARDRQGLLIQSIENELREPAGAPIPGVPELQVSAVMWSPDCSYFLESKGPPLYPPTDGQHLVGVKHEVLLYESRMWLLSFAAIMFGQIYLLRGQIKESSTPSTIGRVSFYTAGMMLLADGLIFASAAAWTLSASTTLLPSLLLTFSSLMSMAIGGAFLSEVYKIQEPERRNRERERGASSPDAIASPPPPPPTPAAAAAAAAATRARTTVSELPRPVTAGPGRAAETVPIIIPSDQDIDAEIAGNLTAGAVAVPRPAPQDTAAPTAARTPTAQQARATTTFSSIAGRFILLGTCIVFLSLAATTWPTAIRSAYVNIIAFIYLSLWLPQIWRNIQRNSRRAYSWRFTIGQSALRLLPFAYFYLREDNILFADPDWRSFALLAAWLWLQLWVLASQDVLGPRFGIPRGWAPEAWDYHPVLREDNLEAGGLPIGLVSSPRRRRSSAESKEGGGGGGGGRPRPHMHAIDCAICCERFEVPVVPAGTDPDAVGAGTGVAAVLARRAYMVTPCRHVFHTPCLEGWLRFRLQCPICREELPPL